MAQSHGLFRLNLFLGVFILSAQIPGTQPAGLPFREMPPPTLGLCKQKGRMIFLLFQFLKAAHAMAQVQQGFCNTGLHFGGSYGFDLQDSV